jgi:hypothetical protein
MVNPISQIEDVIRKNVAKLLEEESIKDKIEEEGNASSRDLLFLNNSFVYRDSVDTTKHPEYLCLQWNEELKLDVGSLRTGFPAGFNSDVKKFSHESNNKPKTRLLGQAVKEHVKNLGQLVYVLIGRIDDTITCEEKINHKSFDRLRFDPAAEKLASIENRVIIVNTLWDPQAAWDACSASEDGLMPTDPHSARQL